MPRLELYMKGKYTVETSG